MKPRCSSTALSPTSHVSSTINPLTFLLLIFVTCYHVAGAEPELRQLTLAISLLVTGNLYCDFLSLLGEVDGVMVNSVLESADLSQTSLQYLSLKPVI